MANSLLTISMITREAVRLWKNTNSFIRNVDMQYDDQYARTGAKIGTSLRIRLPNDYVVRTGATAVPQDTAETSTTLVLATQKGVDVSFGMAERTLSLDDYSRRILAPMINNLVGAVAADVMSGVEGGISNFTSAKDGANAVIAPTAGTWLEAGAILDIRSAPTMNRKAILDPLTMARTVQTLSGLFNSAPRISDQYESGQMVEALGYAWYKDQTVIKHTTASYSGSLTVNGAGQTGTTLVVNAITGGFALGEIITIAGVNAVNRITKQDTGQPQQFVVTAAAGNGATSLSIYPAIIPGAVAYQTVTASPANGAVITPVTNAGQVYRKNFVFAPEAVTMATADLEIPNGVHEAARESFDDVSLRMISAYNVLSDQMVTRLDVLYGYLWVRPEWACVVADAI